MIKAWAAFSRQCSCTRVSSLLFHKQRRPHQKCYRPDNQIQVNKLLSIHSWVCRCKGALQSPILNFLTIFFYPYAFNYFLFPTWRTVDWAFQGVRGFWFATFHSFSGEEITGQAEKDQGGLSLKDCRQVWVPNGWVNECTVHPFVRKSTSVRALLSWPYQLRAVIDNVTAGEKLPQRSQKI